MFVGRKLNLVSAQDWSITSAWSPNIIRVMEQENIIEAFYGKRDFSRQKVMEKCLIYSSTVLIYQPLET